MKKNITLLFSISVISLFLSCNFTFKGNELTDKPRVQYSNNQAVLVIPYKSDTTKYINIYRKNVNDESESISNIGILYTSAYTTTIDYPFFDSLIEKNISYSYRVRYCDNGEYFYSEWSDPIIAIEGLSETPKYNADEASFYLNDSDYSLKIEGTILPPELPNFEKDYVPMLIVSNESETQAFKLESLSDGSVVALRGRLPVDFIDIDISILGIVAQKSEIEVNENPEIEPKTKSVLWTALTPINIVGIKDNKFKIPSLDGQDGLDYSKKIN